MATVDLIGPRGETVTVSELGPLQHYVNARGYKLSTGTYTDAVALLSGYASSPTIPSARLSKWQPSTAYAQGDLVVNPAGQIVQAKSAFTSAASYSATNWTVVPAGGGVTPVTTGFTTFYAGGAGNVLNTTSGTSTATVAGTTYYAGLLIPMAVTLTGITVTIGVTGGTDKWIVALYDPAGNVVANSSLAGVTVGTAQTKQSIPFTAPVSVNGPGGYYVALQSNGATATFRSFSNVGETFATGSAAGTFGTLPQLSLAGTYTVNVGPYAATY